MPVSPDRLQELTWPERHLFLRSGLNGVDFRDHDSLRLYLATYLVQNPYLSKAQVIGALPKEKEALVVTNHVCEEDVFLIHWLSVVTAKRTLRLVAKETLVNPDAQESEIMKSRRRKKGPLRRAVRALGIDKALNRYIAVPYARAFNVIPFNVGDQFGARAMQSMQEMGKEFRGGNMAASFLTGTKSPPLDLLDTLPLAAFTASLYPDLPIITAGISYKPFIIRIADKELTYRHVLEEHAPGGVTGRREGIEIMNRVITDSVGNLIADPRLRPAWWLERNGLYSEEELRARYAERENPKDIYDLYLKIQRGIRGPN